MNKIWILTCVNAINGDVMCVKPFRTETEARADMEGQYNQEKENAEKLGYTIDDYFSGIEGKTAGIMYGDFQLKWSVTDIDNPFRDDLDQAVKQQFLDQVYFEAAEDLNADEVYNLTYPTGNFCAFYVDTNAQTINVWNCKKRNYTSIFSMDIDEAYEVAKSIRKGEYEWDNETDITKD